MYVFCITNIRHTQRKLGNYSEVEKSNCISNKFLVTPGPVHHVFDYQDILDKQVASTREEMWRSVEQRISCGRITGKCVSSVSLRGLHHSVLFQQATLIAYIAILYAVRVHPSSLKDVEMQKRNSSIFSSSKDCVNISIYFLCLVSVHRLLVC